ncbi:hypothetical protein VCJ71_07320 [Alteriqipengyuania sp. WL0013]|uniref:hypothetical protein n=1 Tax=Alteriqipengyuania sp. WL0013 TaxID=3110773 RepID=UPI002C4D3923|nr:hypothetical protein [Alteriqipengyuania sp. WL0013]MEB3415873.1 hypothetical protein [Alteriqipengyuania sp. WL0013]
MSAFAKAIIGTFFVVLLSFVAFSLYRGPGLLTALVEPKGAIDSGCKFNICTGDSYVSSARKLNSQGYARTSVNEGRSIFLEKKRKSQTISLHEERGKVVRVAWNFEVWAL